MFRLMREFIYTKIYVISSLCIALSIEITMCIALSIEITIGKCVYTVDKCYNTKRS